MAQITGDSIIRTTILQVKASRADSIDYARTMKAQNPHKQDYGYGEAGHTLNNWEDMKAFFLQYGPKGVAAKGHKMISQTYRKKVGKIIDKLIADSVDFNRYLGHYCWSGSAEQLVNSTKEAWLTKMIEKYPDVSPYALKAGQKTAWGSSFSAMKKALKNNKPKNALLVFEYALPLSLGEDGAEMLVWPDALIVTDKKIVVLEFKNRPLNDDKIIEHFLSQAQKYQRRLEKYHVASQEKTIECILVSTKMHNAFRKTNAGVFCSGDQLNRAISKAFPTAAKAFDYEDWLNSQFIGTQPKPKKTKVLMRFDDSMIGAVQDRFGNAVNIRQTGQYTYVASVLVNPDKLLFDWVADLEPGIEIIGPDDVTKSYDEYLYELLNV